jgi:dihydroneopterin aldolase/2-amino-4-hydroxy-6-hydroxymethyldihydropteridine diphosphokinase
MDWVVSEAGEPLDTLEILGISAHGYHGVLTAERAVGQPFVVDLRLYLDTRPAAAQDRLDLAVDYAAIAARVAAIIGGEPVFLIETLAQRIADAVLTHEPVQAAEIAVHKPSAPLSVHVNDVIVRIHRTGGVARLVVTPGASVAGPAAEPDEPAADAEAGTTYPRRPPAPRPGSGEIEIPAAEAQLPEAAEFGTPGVDVSKPIPVVDGAGEALDPVALLTARGLPLTRRNLAAAAAELAEQAPAEESQAWASGPTLVPEVARVDAADPSHCPATSLDDPPLWPTDVILSLGANLGDALGTLRQAIDSLRSVPGIEVIGVSPLARTKPVGFVDQPDFFNAVVAIRTTLSPRALLHTVQGIEEQYGRDRAQPAGPRTLDIDIVAFDTLLDGDEELEIPHPRAHERAFVLLPWATLSPGAFLPGLDGGAVAVLAGRAPDRDGVHWLALDWLTLPVSLTGALPKPPSGPPDESWAG